MGQENSHHPKPGDLIEIDLPVYQHWALYLVDGFVINVLASDKGGSALLAAKATVKKQLLEEAVEGDTWRVNNKYDHSRTPLPVEEIIRRAERWIDREVPYNLVWNNCEHFVTELRYGEGVSGQVATLFSILAPGGFLVYHIGNALRKSVFET